MGSVGERVFCLLGLWIALSIPVWPLQTLELRGKVAGEAERECGKCFKDVNISREEGFGKKKRSWKGIHGKSPPSHQGELFG